MLELPFKGETKMKNNSEYQLVYDILNEYLIEEDGTYLISDHARVQNMLERLSMGQESAKWMKICS